MANPSQLEQSPPLTAMHEVATRPRQVARPAGRAVASGAGRRGFAVLFVAGVAINVWALFPSAVESGVLVPLPSAAKPDVTKPAVVDAESGGTGSRDPSRGMAFRLLEFDPVSSHSTTHRSVQYSGVAVSVGTLPVRSKLQALLLLLSAQYGDDVHAMALQLKLQALLKLPDSVLAQLMHHPELANLNTLLDGMYLGAPDLSGVRTELDKITVSSTAGPTEQIDVVTINGEPAYVVHSPLAENTTDGIAAARLSAPSVPPSEFVVVTQIEAHEEVTTTSVVPSVEAFLPAFGPTAEIMADFTTAPSVEPVEPSFVMEAPLQEPPSSTAAPVDMEIEDETEPVEFDDDATSAERGPVPSAGPSDDEPADTPGPTHDPAGPSEDGNDSTGAGAQGESSP